MTDRKTPGQYERQFNRAVDAKMDDGMTRGQAVAAIAKDNHDLHRKYLDEYTAARHQKDHGPAKPGTYEAKFNAAVDQKVADGKMTRAQATRAVGREQPELRQKYVDECNATA